MEPNCQGGGVLYSGGGGPSGEKCGVVCVESNVRRARGTPNCIAGHTGVVGSRCARFRPALRHVVNRIGQGDHVAGCDAAGLHAFHA